MKTTFIQSTLFICLLTFISISLTAQVPDAFKYQAVLRDNNGQIMENQAVTLRLSILQNTTEVYQETHALTTNDYGLVSVNVGTGTVVSGNFSAIDWGADIHYIKIEVNPGSGYVDMGTVQLLSVPYALYAAKADELSGGISETDPVYSVSVASGITSVDTAYWNSKSDFDGDFNSLQNIPASIWVPAGVISMFAGTTPPAGYLLCDGSEISRTTYTSLFAVIGETYGAGDGSTTFNLPNFNGRIPVGYDASQTEFDQLAETGGAKTHTLDVSEIPSHNHNGTTDAEGDHSHTGTTSSDGEHTHTATTALDGGHTPSGTVSVASHTHTASTSTAGDHTHTYSYIWWQNSTTAVSPGGTPYVSPYAIPFIRNADGTTYNDGAFDDLRFYRSSDNSYVQPQDIDWVSIWNSEANVPTWAINNSGNHTHTVTVDSSTPTATFTGVAVAAHSHTVTVDNTTDHSHTLSTNTTGSHSHTFSTSNTGANAAHNIMQPYITINYIIKY